MTTFDVAVVGLGAVGSALACRLARDGMSVVGFDAFHPPHDRGSSHGETRLTRLANGEGDAYAPLAQRSAEIWRDLEEESGEMLLVRCGAVIIANPDHQAERIVRRNFLRETQAVAERFGITHEVLSADELRHRFPQFSVSDDDLAYFEPGAGYLRPEACIAVQLELARRAGATLRLGCRIRAVADQGGCVRLSTDDGSVSAGVAAICAGPWAGQLLGAPFDAALAPYRQTLHWFEVGDDMAEAWRHGPVFTWSHGTGAGDFFYGFPCLPGARGVKVGTESFGASSDPETPARIDPDAARRSFDRHLNGRLVGLRTEGAVSMSCLYTVTRDFHFAVGPIQDGSNLWLVSACSGHGFKHAPAVAEAIAARLGGREPAADLSAFDPARLFRAPPDIGTATPSGGASAR